MQENRQDFFKDVKKWAQDAPDGLKFIRAYNKGLITLSEAIRAINAAYMDHIQLININR